MRYHSRFYIDILLEVARFYLASMVSFQAGVAVVFTGVWATFVMGRFGIPQYLQDIVFFPCGIYFLWALVITIIDINIERDVL